MASLMDSSSVGTGFAPEAAGIASASVPSGKAATARFVCGMCVDSVKTGVLSGARVQLVQVAPVGGGVDLEHRPRARGGLDQPLDVHRVGLAGLDLAAG